MNKIVSVMVILIMVISSLAIISENNVIYNSNYNSPLTITSGIATFNESHLLRGFNFTVILDDTTTSTTSRLSEISSGYNSYINLSFTTTLNNSYTYTVSNYSHSQVNIASGTFTPAANIYFYFTYKPVNTYNITFDSKGIAKVYKFSVKVINMTNGYNYSKTITINSAGINTVNSIVFDYLFNNYTYVIENDSTYKSTTNNTVFTASTGLTIELLYNLYTNKSYKINIKIRNAVSDFKYEITLNTNLSYGYIAYASNVPQFRSANYIFNTSINPNFSINNLANITYFYNITIVDGYTYYISNSSGWLNFSGHNDYTIYASVNNQKYISVNTAFLNIEPTNLNIMSSSTANFVIHLADNTSTNAISFYNIQNLHTPFNINIGNSPNNYNIATFNITSYQQINSYTFNIRFPTIYLLKGTYYINMSKSITLSTSATLRYVFTNYYLSSTNTFTSNYASYCYDNGNYYNINSALQLAYITTPTVITYKVNFYGQTIKSGYNYQVNFNNVWATSFNMPNGTYTLQTRIYNTTYGNGNFIFYGNVSFIVNGVGETVYIPDYVQSVIISGASQDFGIQINIGNYNDMFFCNINQNGRGFTYLFPNASLSFHVSGSPNGILTSVSTNLISPVNSSVYVNYSNIHYTFSLDEIGLPAGQIWIAEFNNTNKSTSGNSLTFTNLLYKQYYLITYSINQYVPNVKNVSISMTVNTTYYVYYAIGYSISFYPNINSPYSVIIANNTNFSNQIVLYGNNSNSVNAEVQAGKYYYEANSKNYTEISGSITISSNSIINLNFIHIIEKLYNLNVNFTVKGKLTSISGYIYFYYSNLTLQKKLQIVKQENISTNEVNNTYYISIYTSQYYFDNNSPFQVIINGKNISVNIPLEIYYKLTLQFKINKQLFNFTGNIYLYYYNNSLFKSYSLTNAMNLVVNSINESYIIYAKSNIYYYDNNTPQTVSINGNNTTSNITFYPYITYDIYESGLPLHMKWFINVNGTVYTSYSNLIQFELPANFNSVPVQIGNVSSFTSNTQISELTTNTTTYHITFTPIANSPYTISQFFLKYELYIAILILSSSVVLIAIGLKRRI